ncbi:MAG TPA: YbbR-like domain-containing protein [Polyangiaceae bacterium]|jgi:YbbR domain-containing protein
MAIDIADRARALFTENLSLKILSFLFALVLYSLVHDAQDAQRVVDLGVTVRVPPDAANRTLVAQSATKVRLTLRGSRAALDDIHTDDLGTLQVDAHAGTEKDISLAPEMVHALPPGVRVEEIDPPVISLKWEDEVVRDVPVEVSIVGSPASGYVIKGVPTSDPPTIRVRGAKSEVLTLQHARTEAFEVTGLTEGAYPRELSVDKKVGLGYTASEVKATVVIARELVERPFTKLPVAVVGPAKAHTIPAEVDVRLTCPPEILRALRPEQVVPQVEVTSKESSGVIAHVPVEVAVEKCNALVMPDKVIVKW